MRNWEHQGWAFFTTCRLRSLVIQHGALPLSPSPQNGFQISGTVELLQKELWWARGRKYCYTGAKKVLEDEKAEKLMHAVFSSGTPPKWVIEQVWQTGREKQQYPGRGRSLQLPPSASPHRSLLSVDSKGEIQAWLERAWDTGTAWPFLLITKHATSHNCEPHCPNTADAIKVFLGGCRQFIVLMATHIQWCCLVTLDATTLSCVSWQNCYLLGDTTPQWLQPQSSLSIVLVHVCLSFFS